MDKNKINWLLFICRLLHLLVFGIFMVVTFVVAMIIQTSWLGWYYACEFTNYLGGDGQ